MTVSIKTVRELVINYSIPDKLVNEASVQSAARDLTAIVRLGSGWARNELESISTIEDFHLKNDLQGIIEWLTAVWKAISKEDLVGKSQKES